ncbi:MAG TPA: hypothetical protein VHM26_03085 [Chitinophagaceae bacterium]|jgi:hypothetical protein|nr:hypothetical protein [Chitinophagaceae bacterium]
MEQVFSLDTHYELKDDQSKVTLDVLIGDEGQSPDYTVRLNTKKLIEHSNASIKNFDLGIDTDLNGKALRINGNIADTSKQSNKIELTLRIKGGIDDLKKKFSVTVEDEGEVVLFSLVIRFFA